MADVSRETRLAKLTALVIEENARQNLVSVSSVADFRRRHIDDSLQLSALLPDGPIVDIGSGAGFPGLVIAIMRDDPVILVEPRRRRATFLRETAETLGLTHVTIHSCRIERIGGIVAGGITARAVASLTDLFGMAAHVADENTRWVLPKGRTAGDELAIARRTWQGSFMLVPSLTDPSASVVVADRVTRRSAR